MTSKLVEDVANMLWPDETRPPGPATKELAAEVTRVCMEAAAKVAEHYDDCSPRFVAEKIRALAQDDKS